MTTETKPIGHINNAGQVLVQTLNVETGARGVQYFDLDELVRLGHGGESIFDIVVQMIPETVRMEI